MRKKVTAIFDIGKTNKKFFLYDREFQEVYKENTQFDEIKDEDGHPTEHIEALKTWLVDLFNRILSSTNYNVKAINFSTYGASFVHIDNHGNLVAPLYNYTKPIRKELVEEFYKKYGPENEFYSKTGSPNLGMLNSGLQLYWLKHDKPEVFQKIRYSLHLPQFLSYIFTGIPVSEYTSIGCHTALWDFTKKDYHDWVYQEGIDQILPPIVPTEMSMNMNYNGKRIKIGVGIHDSSASLLPYIRSAQHKFALVSTGTWSITLNPYTSGVLNEADIAGGSINYMRINGKPVRASRLFLGNEYKHQIQVLAKHYKKHPDDHKSIKFDSEMHTSLVENFEPMFTWKEIEESKKAERSWKAHETFEKAYHQLMLELVMLQVKSIKGAIGSEKITKVYVDGGFRDNEVYLKMLSIHLKDMELHTADDSWSSALGAAIAISDPKLNSKFFKKTYALQKHMPLIIK